MHPGWAFPLTEATPALPAAGYSVEELCRETLGRDTCDARRSASDPDPDHPGDLEGLCPFDRGLRTKWPKFDFPVVQGEGKGLGLVSDRDTLWHQDEREHQKKQVNSLLPLCTRVAQLVT